MYSKKKQFGTLKLILYHNKKKVEDNSANMKYQITEKVSSY